MRGSKVIFKRKFILMSAVAFIAAVFAAMLFYEYTGGTVWTNDAYIEGYGTDLGASVTQRIVGLYCDEGDFVKKGQLIAEIYRDVPLAKKAEAEARIESLKQEINVKEAYYKKIRNDYTRALQGIEDQVISAQDYDHSEKNLEIAEAELALAIANLEEAKREYEVIIAELTNYTVCAPQDGVIAKRWVWLGDVTSPGQSLFTMYDLENIWVTANLEEYKIENVKIGSPVRIHIDAYPSYTFSGNVFVIKGAAASQFSLVPQNNATGNYTKVAQRIPVKITIERPENFPKDKPLYLFPGMSAEVRIQARR